MQEDLDELLFADESVSIGIDFLEDLLRLLPVGLQEHLHFPEGDGAVVVDVEVFEGLFEILVATLVIEVGDCDQELRIVDDPRAIGVEVVEELLHLAFVLRDELHGSWTTEEVVEREDHGQSWSARPLCKSGIREYHRPR